MEPFCEHLGCVEIKTKFRCFLAIFLVQLKIALFSELVQEPSNSMSRGGRIHAYVAAFRGTLCPLVPAPPFWH